MLRILFLAASPTDRVKLDLESEAEAIRERLDEAEFGGQIEFVHHGATKSDDLLRLLSKDDDWQVVHFSGHGSRSHQIELVDDDGAAKPVSGDSLRQFFKLLGGKTRLVVFNACHAEVQAEVVSQEVPCAIGMSDTIGNQAAILFSAALYRAIGFGKSLKEALEHGKLAIEFEDLAQEQIPRLHCRPGANPDQLFLMPGGSTSRVIDEWTRLAPRPPALRDGMDWHAFLSYRSASRAWVLNLRDVLDRHGYRVFLDQYELLPGDSLVHKLEGGLERSQSGVLIWSDKSEDSAWCRREYEVFVTRELEEPGFRFIVIFLGGRLPASARTKGWIDFTDHPDGPNGGGLLGLLHALADDEPSPAALRFIEEQEEASKDAERQVKAAIDSGLIKDLMKLHSAGGIVWQTSAVLGSRVGEALIKLGAYDEALRVLKEVTHDFPRAVRPKQLEALAYARRKGPDDLEEAQRILALLRADDRRDPETLGIYARTWMDRYAQTGEERFLRRSRKLYAEAFASSPTDTYTGINAAAKSVFLGDLAEGQEYARKVLDYFRQSNPVDYYEEATVPEAELILGNWIAAKEGYQEAVDRHGSEMGSLKSTFLQFCRLSKHLDIPGEVFRAIEKVFQEVVGKSCEEMIADA